MKAAVYDSYGGPEVLHEGLVAVPEPTSSELLVRVHAASVNGYDLIVRSGGVKMMSGRNFPKRTGLDFAGEVVTVAGDTPQFRKGDRVWGVMPLHRVECAAEFVCVAPEHVAHSPAGLDLVLAAALPVVGATAVMALREVTDLKRGERLLVRGASGGVGSVAVQFARALGAHVTGLASATSLEFVRKLGADNALDYAKTGPKDIGPFDVILDTVGTDARAWRGRLTPGGRMAATVPDPRHPLISMAHFAATRVHGKRRIRFFSAKPDTQSPSGKKLSQASQL